MIINNKLPINRKIPAVFCRHGVLHRTQRQRHVVFTQNPFGSLTSFFPLLQQH